MNDNDKFIITNVRNKILYVCAMNKFVVRMRLMARSFHFSKITRGKSLATKNHIFRNNFSAPLFNIPFAWHGVRKAVMHRPRRGIRLERDDFHRDGFHTYPSSRHSGATFVPRCTVSGAGCSRHRIPLMCLCIWPTHGPVVDTGVCAF